MGELTSSDAACPRQVPDALSGRRLLRPIYLLVRRRIRIPAELVSVGQANQSCADLRRGPGRLLGRLDQRLKRWLEGKLAVDASIGVMGSNLGRLYAFGHTLRVQLSRVLDERSS